MPAVKRPKKGPIAFWPRRRAARIYPSVTSFPESDKPKVLGFAGYKAGMTNVILFDNRKGFPTFGQEISVPVTILECPPLKVVGIRAYEKNAKGLQAITEAWSTELPKELARKLKVKPKMEIQVANLEKVLQKISVLRFVVATQPVLTGVKKKTPEVFEIEIGGKDVKEKFDFAKQLLGKDANVSDVVKEGELVDVIAVSKGKGTAGPVERFGIRIQNRHAKQKLRHVGAIAQQVPRRVRFTSRQAGQLGYQNRTELNKRVLKIGSGSEVTPANGINRYGIVKSSYVLLSGSVPGPKKRLIFLRSPIRPQKVKLQVPEIREVMK